MSANDLIRDRLVDVQRKIADLNQKRHAWQRVRPELYVIFLKIFDTFSNAVVSDLCIVEHDRPILFQHVETKAKISNDRNICMFAINKT